MTSSKSLPNFLTNPDSRIYEGGNYVVLDFETTNLDKGSALNAGNRLVLSVYRTGPEHPNHRRGSTRIWGGEFEVDELVRDIRQADFLIAHNAKFELQWLERCGLDLTNVVVWCTQIGDYVIGGNRYVGNALSLENCAQRRYGEGKVSIVSKMIKAGVCPSDIPQSWLEEYCIQDVDLTERLFYDQLADMQELDLLNVMYTRCLATPVLADIEKNGMQVDPDLVRTRLEEIERKFAVAEQELNDITGGINLNSPKQVGTYLYDTLGFDELMRKRGGKWEPIRSDKGQRKADADTIQALKCKTDAQKTFVAKYREYKELYNELTKYLRKFADCARDAEGILQASFNQTNTRTHRLSSTGTKYSCQFQNFPRAYKPLFKARTAGWLVGECDGAQLEFRVAAHLGNDPVALEDIVNGTDIHSVTAGVIGCTRQEAKPHTFKPLYGGQSGTEAEKRYYTFFREKYAGINDAQRTWIDEVLANKYLVTEWGMRYYWPNTRMDRSGYVTNTTSICNYPVQAFATAEIIPIALVHFWHRTKRLGTQMFITNTVHDSIIVELPPEEVELFHELSKQCLIDDVYTYLEALYDIRLIVPLGAGVKVGTNWNGPDCASHVPEGLEHDKGEVVYTAEENLYE